MTGVNQLESAYEHYLKCRTRGVIVKAFSGGWFHSNDEGHFFEYINRMPSDMYSYIQMRRAEDKGMKIKDINLYERQ